MVWWWIWNEETGKIFVLIFLIFYYLLVVYSLRPFGAGASCLVFDHKLASFELFLFWNGFLNGCTLFAWVDEVV